MAGGAGDGNVYIDTESDFAVKAKLLAEAEPLLLEGCEGMKQRESTIPPQTVNAIDKALDRLIELYTATGKAEELHKWKSEKESLAKELDENKPE